MHPKTIFWLWVFMIPFRPNGTAIGPENIAICGNCRHMMVSATGATTTCRLFGSVDPVMGTVHYRACSSMRADESCCGRDARYFMRNIPFASSDS